MSAAPPEISPPLIFNFGLIPRKETGVCQLEMPFAGALLVPQVMGIAADDAKDWSFQRFEIAGAEQFVKPGVPVEAMRGMLASPYPLAIPMWRKGETFLLAVRNHSRSTDRHLSLLLHTYSRPE